MANRSLKPAPPDLIGQLQLSQDQIAAFVTDRYFALHPGCAHADSPRIRRLCHEDTAHHLNQLCSALELGDATTFDAYLDWLRSVLIHRQLPLQHTIDALALMRDWIAAHIPHAAADDAVAIIEHGIDRFQDDASASALIASQSLAAPSVAVAEYSRALIAGHRSVAVQCILDEMARGTSLVDVSVDLVQPALYQIGRLWEQNHVSVAQEHMATAITQNALAAGFAQAQFVEPNGRTAVFACVENNHHGIGLRMVSDAYEVAGWEVSFLGTNTPTPAIISFVAETKPDLLGLSAALAHHLSALREVISRVRAEMGNAAPQIIIGGLPLNAQRGSVLRLGADECFFDAREAVRASG